uniref:Uncharacterized protein n=1 Tax=Rhizobium rhizogenes TaxID=359 RepID=A0A7S4ZSN6_RHIRH|nr:hypothetical protein pC5.8a_218 [Rhizobium rhizogenes]QCL10347.1 hypothetical protein pC6.5b_453 [Rhizobium rhizogenes]QCL10502.1 hypothetical protein pC6.5c_609 [Rhizobium rhizogenes]
MEFVSWRLIGILRLHSQRHSTASDGGYEPWVSAEMDRFEREIEAFY